MYAHFYIPLIVTECVCKWWYYVTDLIYAIVSEVPIKKNVIYLADSVFAFEESMDINNKTSVEVLNCLYFKIQIYEKQKVTVLYVMYLSSASVFICSLYTVAMP